MNMTARAVNAVRNHRFGLPLVLLKKLLGPWLVTETIVVYRYDLRPDAGSGSPGMTAAGLPGDGPGCGEETPAMAPAALCRLRSADSDMFKFLSQSFPGTDFAARFTHAGTECLVALCGGDMAGYAWANRAPLHIAEINLVYPLAADELFIYDCFVRTEFRRRGIYTAMIGAILGENRKGGDVQRAYIAASALNRASVKGILKAGFMECGRIRYVKWRGRERWWGANQ